MFLLLTTTSGDKCLVKSEDVYMVIRVPEKDYFQVKMNDGAFVNVLDDPVEIDEQFMKKIKELQNEQNAEP